MGSGIIDVLLTIDRNLRPLIRHALNATTVDRQHVVLAGLDVPHPDHRNQAVALLLSEVHGLGEILVEIVELPPLGVEFDELVVVDRRAEGEAGFGERSSWPRAHGPPTVVIERAMAHHLEILGDVERGSLGVVE